MASLMNRCGNLWGSPYGPAKVILLLLSAGAFYATWGLSVLDGTLNRMLAIRHGIPPIDYWFTIMVLFFWQAVDGSHPDTSLCGVYFLGQLISIWALVWIEGLRKGNKGLGVSSIVFWACAMQNLTLACLGGIYFTIHLSTSPTVLAKNARVERESKAALTVPRSELRLLPISLVLGYVIPSVLIALPSPKVQSYASQQAAIAIWTPFPVWVGLAHSICTKASSYLFPADEKTSDAQEEGYRRTVRLVYATVAAGSTIVHVASVTLSICTVLFPMMFASGYSVAFHPFHMLFPGSVSDVNTIGQGVLHFMQWDQIIGYSSVLIWASIMLWNGQGGKLSGWWDAVQLTLKVLGMSLLTGPGTAAVGLLWARDEAILGEYTPERLYEEKKL